MNLVNSDKTKDRDKLAVRHAWPSKDEGKVETMSHLQLSLLLGDLEEVAPEEERDKEQDKKQKFDMQYNLMISGLEINAPQL